ncbi:NAD(P)-binding domain-containing protein [Acinetobacter pittii]|uniref:NAD(P)-binding domain-containing protein n=1 Tax=Acinetobacter pittii TaxID=48296 RepID=UPI002A04D9D7|nr:NAD(P)-binding domain-containing protein [Acinetobacter pittii]MDX8237962.1 NAD(P)-binding domain-containing protein [Acinetobacter pittii]
MKKISVIGTGKMGSAFAKTLVKANLDVHVWDQFEGATKSSVESGAKLAANLNDALEVSEIIISLVSSASIGIELFEKVDPSLFKGKYIINFSTALPEDGEKFQTLIESNKGYFINAAISSYPDLIGSSLTVIQYAGPKEYFSAVENSIKPLAPEATLYVGTNLKKPAIVDAAMTGSFYAVALAGFVEACAYLNSQGIDPLESEDFAYKMVDLLKYKIKKTLGEIKNNDFSTIQATVDVYYDATIQWRDALNEAGLKGSLISAVASDLKDAQQQGQGNLGFTSQYLSAKKISKN